MICPRCSLPLRTTEYEGVEVDVCDSCWGFWLDKGELSEILNSRALTFSEEERQAILDVRTASRRGDERLARCPKCQQPMKHLRYDESVYLTIDNCPAHGDWLDTGEIKTVQAIAESSRAIHGMLIRKLRG